MSISPVFSIVTIRFWPSDQPTTILAWLSSKIVMFIQHIQTKYIQRLLRTQIHLHIYKQHYEWGTSKTRISVWIGWLWLCLPLLIPRSVRVYMCASTSPAHQCEFVVRQPEPRDSYRLDIVVMVHVYPVEPIFEQSCDRFRSAWLERWYILFRACERLNWWWWADEEIRTNSISNI